MKGILLYAIAKFSCVLNLLLSRNSGKPTSAGVERLAWLMGYRRPAEIDSLVLSRLLNVRLDRLKPIDIRTLRVLNRGNLYTVRDVLNTPMQTFVRIRNSGPK